MRKILANDGIDDSGKQLLEEAGFFVETNKIEQSDLPNRINEYDAIIVRSATTVRKELIDVASNLKVIGRAGVGMDNIDVAYAQEKGKKVVNTPAASSLSVAELVFAHLLSGARFLAENNRVMAIDGNGQFKNLKKNSSAGIELRGKTLGIIGFGRIGQACAKIAIGMGMKVMYYDPHLPSTSIYFELDEEFGIAPLEIPLNCAEDMLDILHNSDFITLHIPGGKSPVIGEKEIAMMKNGAGIVNCARGGVIDEKALHDALTSGKLAFAGLDVFEQEPPVYDAILKLKNVSLSPHIGASTNEAQERIGIEMAEKVIEALK